MKHAFSKVFRFITYLLAYVLSTFVETEYFEFVEDTLKVEKILIGKKILLTRVYLITDSGRLRTYSHSVNRFNLDEALVLDKYYNRVQSRKDLTSSRVKHSREVAHDE